MHGLIKNSSKDFIKPKEVVAVHFSRYNSQIQRLLEVQDYTMDDIASGLINRREYYSAREKKRKAYMDAIATIGQKEKLLQYHSDGFQIEIVEEKVEVKQAKQEYDTSKLTFDEKVELMNLLVKSKKNRYDPVGVISSASEYITTVGTEAEIVDQPSNMEGIQIEEPKELPFEPTIKSTDPTFKLKEALNRLAAKKFKEAGGNMTEEEEKLL